MESTELPPFNPTAFGRRIEQAQADVMRMLDVFEGRAGNLGELQFLADKANEYAQLVISALTAVRQLAEGHQFLEARIALHRIVEWHNILNAELGRMFENTPDHKENLAQYEQDEKQLEKDGTDANAVIEHMRANPRFIQEQTIAFFSDTRFIREIDDILLENLPHD
jgi:hypothetical protein